MSKKKYLVGMDFGTTGCKTVIYDLEGNEVSVASQDTESRFPKPGWVDQDAEERIEQVYSTNKAALENSDIDPEDIVGISFTHMCTSVVPVDKDGNFLWTLLIWQDTRGKEVIPDIKKMLADAGMTEEDDYQRTGLPIATLYPYTKILWFRKHHPDLYEKTDKWLTMQSLLTSAYTGNYYEEKPDIGYTKIADPDTFEFKKDLADIYGFDLSDFHERVDPGTLAGHVTKEVAEKTGFKEGTPVYVGTGDNRAATVGNGVNADGETLVTIGTAGVVCAYSSKPVRHDKGKIQILGHATGNWQVEANSNAGASSLRWYSNHLAQLENAYADLTEQSVFALLGDLAEKSPAGANGVLYLPWLQGASTPRYDDSASGTFTGLSYFHDKADITRSVMEGVIFEINTMLEEVENTTGVRAEKIRITGGAAKSDLWNQMQADIYNRPVETTEASEGAAIGAAMCVGIGAGIFDDFQDAIDHMVHVEKKYDPIPENIEKYKELHELTKKAYNGLSGEFFDGLDAYQEKAIE